MAELPLKGRKIRVRRVHQGQGTTGISRTIGYDFPKLGEGARAAHSGLISGLQAEARRRGL